MTKPEETPSFAAIALRKWRLDNELTKEVVGTRLHVCVSTVSCWERGKSTPSPRSRQRIASLTKNIIPAVAWPAHARPESDKTALKQTANKLRAWLNVGGLSFARFAERVGVSETAVQHWISCRHRPSSAIRANIERETEGHIKAEEWGALGPQGK